MGVLVRIFLRWLAGILVAKGVFDSEAGNMLATDPEVARALEIGLGLAIGALAEGWYMLARRCGWRT